jgi:ABC-type multidrug transport system fused ATPase/permease subunit
MMHILRNTVISIFILSIVSIADAANITVAPSSGNYKVGSTISVNVFISNNQEPVNAVSANLAFTNNTLSLTSISKSGSIIDLWAEEPTYSNNSGTVSFEGGMYNPGFSGLQGKVLTINFKVISAGVTNIRLVDGSVLSNDGNATNVLGTLGSATYNITEEVVEPKPTPNTEPVKTETNNLLPNIVSNSYPDSNKWYSTKNAIFKWSVPSGVTSVSTLYGTNPIATPSKVYTPAINSKNFVVDNDGVFYMHVQFKNENGWGPTSHFKFQVDSTTPDSLVANLTDGATTYSQTPEITVVANDNMSGLDQITFSIDGGNEVNLPYDANNKYNLPRSAPGKHIVTIYVADKAGNRTQTTLEYTVKTIDTPIITDYSKNIENSRDLYAAGTTYANYKIEVTLKNREGKTFTENTIADEDGVWRLDWKGDIDTGVYELKAKAVDEKGNASAYTDTKVVVVEHIALVRIGMFAMNWLSVVLIIVIVLIAAISAFATLWYSFIQFVRFKRRVRDRIQEIQDAVEENINGLKEDTDEFHSILVKAQKKRELTKEETLMLKKFKKRLETTENDIESKLDELRK